MLRLIKRLLRPFRPWLYPIYRRLLVATRATEASQDEVLAGIDLSGSPIRPMRRDEFEAMAAANPYYRSRWGYTSEALVQAARLIVRDDLRTALEVGAPVKPIITGAHVMDYRFREELDPNVESTIHDATDPPWPFRDKAFDLFIALQVFEHLGSSQVEAFREVRRVARHAIISLPIDWVMDDPRNSHHMIPEERALSWFVPVVPTRTVVHMTGRRKRVIFVFEDLPAP